MPKYYPYDNTLIMIKIQKFSKTYCGGWQHGDTIRQELKGPIGEGSVDYDNGDKFSGYFHLSYAHINGPCYAADGKYTFADGSFIEKAWIVTSSDIEVMDLLGVFRVKHPDGPDSIALFHRNKRYGLELFLAEKPYAIEWYANEKLRELEVASYDIKQLDEDRLTLTIDLPDGTRVIQRGGKLELNNYDRMVFDPSVDGDIYYPDGSSYSHWGWGLKYLKPFSGWGTIHQTNGKSVEQHWENGELVESKPEKWDYRGSTRVMLPDPFTADSTMDAFVWNGHIKYHNKWVYDGEIADNMPNGKGVLVGDDIGTRGRRYEGEFKDGFCHGKGVYTFGDIRQEGEWTNGVFQNPDAPAQAPTLHFKWFHNEWSMGGRDDNEDKKWNTEAKPGKLEIQGFYGIKIESIGQDEIFFADYDRIISLKKGEEIHFHNSIDGYEDHDGCVWDGDEYDLIISWKEN